MLPTPKFVAAVALLVFLACTGCGPTCKTDGDCGKDQICINNECVASAKPAPSADARVIADRRPMDHIWVYDAQTQPDAAFPDNRTTQPDTVAGPDSAGPDTYTMWPDAGSSDRRTGPDAYFQLPDRPRRDTGTPDAVAIPDTAIPDTALPDTTPPDVVPRDTILEDMAPLDHYQPDAWDPVVFRDDFDDDSLDGFTVGMGTWVESGGVLHQTDSCEITNIYASNQSFSDIVAQVDVRWDGSCGRNQAALMVRVTGMGQCTENYYWGCLIDFDSDWFAGGEWNGEYDCITGDGEINNDPYFYADTWYTLSATVVGSTVTCHVTGSGVDETVSYTAWSNAPTGSVGLVSFDGDFSFDNLSVEEL